MQYPPEAHTLSTEIYSDAPSWNCLSSQNTIFINASILAERNEFLVRSKSAFKNIIPSNSLDLNPVNPDENKTNSTEYVSEGTYVKSYEE